MPGSTGINVGDEGYTLLAEGDVARPTGLALADAQRRGVGIKIGNRKAAKLAVATTGLQRSAHEPAKATLAGVEKSLALVLRG